MNLKEYLNLTLKKVEKEAEIELIKNNIDKISKSDFVCFEYEDEIKKIIIGYIKDYLSRANEIKFNYSIINGIAYFSTHVSYAAYDILDNFFEIKIKENGVYDQKIIENTKQFLIKKYLDYKIEDGIFINYDTDKLYFTDIKRFFDLFEINLNKISLNYLVNKYDENKKIIDFFEKQKIMELNELMVFK